VSITGIGVARIVAVAGRSEKLTDSPPGSRRPGPGRPAGNTSALTRQRILEVAHRKFSALGYASATTPEIVAEAGVSQSVLYHHFGSKAALYNAVLTRQMDITIDAFEAAIAGRTKLLDRIDGMLEALTIIGPLYGPDNPIMVIAPFEVRRNPELDGAREQLRRNERFITRLVEDAEDITGVDDGIVQMVLALLWGLTGVGAIRADQTRYLGAVRRLVAGQLVTKD
jgi:AcrR family transcriptional regulator